MASQLTRCLFEGVECAGAFSNATWRMEALAKALHTTGRSHSGTSSVLSGSLVSRMLVAVKTGPHKFAYVQRRELGRTIGWLMLESSQVIPSHPGVTQGNLPPLWSRAQSDWQQRQHVSRHKRRLHSIIRKKVSGATSLVCHRNKRQGQCSRIARVLGTFRPRNKEFLQHTRWNCVAAIGHDFKVLCTNAFISGKKRYIILNLSVAMVPLLEEKSMLHAGRSSIM